MNRTSGRILAGVSVPDTPLVEQALVYARRESEPYLFNHVVRSWLFAARIGQLRTSTATRKSSPWRRCCTTSR